MVLFYVGFTDHHPRHCHYHHHHVQIPILPITTEIADITVHPN